VKIQAWFFRILGLSIFLVGFLFLFFIQNSRSSEVGTIFIIISVVLMVAGDFAARFDRLEKKLDELKPRD
jgi:uncharacterized membrane protein